MLQRLSVTHKGQKARSWGGICFWSSIKHRYVPWSLDLGALQANRDKAKRPTWIWNFDNIQKLEIRCDFKSQVIYSTFPWITEKIPAVICFTCDLGLWFQYTVTFLCSMAADKRPSKRIRKRVWETAILRFEQ